MSSLNDLADRTQDKLEEPRGAGTFWSRANELLPYVVEAMWETTLITGEPELRGTPFTVTANTTLQSMPSGSVAIVRIEGGNGVELKKESVWGLDRMIPGWQAETGNDLKFWFPVGLSNWGVYPLLNASIQVILTYLALPITATRPYAGTEAVPFQDEYSGMLVDHASAIASVKEGGEEFKQGLVRYDAFLARAELLSKYGVRRGSLRQSMSMGPAVRVTPVEKR
jgi:hypothetical protein